MKVALAQINATVGDLLSKPLEKGGLALGTWGTSAALLAVLVIGIAFGYRRSAAPDPAVPDDEPESEPREFARD